MTTKTENAAETNAFSALGDALESAAEKFEEGSAVARQSVAQAAKVTRNLFADGVYKSAYWTSYGFVFSAVYVVNLLPQSSSFRRGLQEGATDTQTKVHAGKKTESVSARARPKLEGLPSDSRPRSRTETLFGKVKLIREKFFGLLGFVTNRHSSKRGMTLIADPRCNTIKVAKPYLGGSV